MICTFFRQHSNLSSLATSSGECRGAKLQTAKQHPQGCSFGTLFSQCVSLPGFIFSFSETVQTCPFPSKSNYFLYSLWQTKILCLLQVCFDNVMHGIYASRFVNIMLKSKLLRHPQCKMHMSCLQNIKHKSHALHHHNKHIQSFQVTVNTACYIQWALFSH